MSQYWLNPVVFVQARAATLNSTSALAPPPSSSSSPSPSRDGQPVAAAPGGFEVWTGDDEYGEDGRPGEPSGAGVTGEERRGRPWSREGTEEQSTSDVARRDSPVAPPSGRPPESDRPPPFACVDVVSLYQQIITQQAGRSALADAGVEEAEGDDAASGGGTADEGAEEEVEEDEDEDIFSERPPPKVAQPPRARSQPSPPPEPEADADADRPLVYCEVCELEVPEDDLARHVRGTAHMLSKAIKDEEAGEGASAAAKHPIFGPHGLGPSNVGYRLAVQAGWEFDKGLGVEGQGIREPIPTTVRIGRLGIGHKKAGRTAVSHSSMDIEKSKGPKITKRSVEDAALQKMTGRQLRRAHERDRAKTKAIMQYLSR